MCTFIMFYADLPANVFSISSILEMHVLQLRFPIQPLNPNAEDHNPNFLSFPQHTQKINRELVFI
jgi:hypothetical protein